MLTLTYSGTAAFVSGGFIDVSKRPFVVLTFVAMAGMAALLSSAQPTSIAHSPTVLILSSTGGPCPKGGIQPLPFPVPPDCGPRTHM